MREYYSISPNVIIPGDVIDFNYKLKRRIVFVLHPNWQTKFQWIII